MNVFTEEASLTDRVSVFGRGSFRTLAGQSAIQIKVFRGFTEPFQANAGIFPLLDHDHFLLDPF
jgi:hypothetical protein